MSGKPPMAELTPEHLHFFAVRYRKVSVYADNPSIPNINYLISKAPMIRIFIVDDHHHFRAQLRSLLESMEEWTVCGEAENGREAVEKHSFHQPHITIMDFNMPVMNGMEASRAILRRHPQAAILMLTVFASLQLVSEAKKHGIKGCCSKLQTDCITLAVGSILRGETYFPSSFAASAGD